MQHYHVSRFTFQTQRGKETNERAERGKRRRTALVTGALGGIGMELARLFARDGFNLVLVARNGDKLAQLAGELQAAHGIGVTVLPKDLAQPQAPDEIFAALQQDGIPVDVLVNNAGFGNRGRFTETAYPVEAEELQVNVVALTHLAKLFLPPMVARRWGKILNVASTAAFQPGPLMAVYYASKAYVLSFSQALAEEVRDSGVTVTALCPGPTDTGFVARAGARGTRLFTLRVMDAPTVAAVGYRALMQGRTMVIPGWRNTLVAQANRFAPRRLSARMAMAAQK